MTVYNVTNEQKATQTSPTFAADPGVPCQMANFFHYPSNRELPPLVDLVVSYDY